MKADNRETAKGEHMQTRKRSPLYYGDSGCALGFIIMVCFVTAVTLAGPLSPVSGQTFATILNVGSWIVPIGLGALGYLYGQRKQKEKFQPVHKIKKKSNDKVYDEV